MADPPIRSLIRPPIRPPIRPLIRRIARPLLILPVPLPAREARWRSVLWIAHASLNSYRRARLAQAAGAEELARVFLKQARWRARYALHRLEALRHVVSMLNSAAPFPPT